LLSTLSILKVAIVIPLMLLFHWLMRNTSVLKVAHKISWVSLGLVWALLVLFIVFAQESGSSFIYFQF
jgi:alginate O-acetyltransferase complex protein AlgI